MTVPTANSSTSLGWTGVETVFPAGFPARDATDVSVSYTPTGGTPSTLTVNVHYSIALDPASAMVSVTPLAMPAAPGVVSIVRTTPELQTVHFVDGEDFTAATHESLHDQHVMRLQEARRDFAAGLALQPNASGPYAHRALYDDVAPPFIFLQTDDSQYRLVYFAKLSAAHADWSSWMIATGPAGAPGTNGSNGATGAAGANGAYAAADSVEAAATAAAYIPVQEAGPVSKRVLASALLAQSRAFETVSALWSGDEAGGAAASTAQVACIMADGTARAWGVGTDYGNGDSGAGQRNLARGLVFDPANAVAPTLPLLQIVKSGSSLFVLDSAGHVYAQGGNSVGQLGLGDTTARRRLTLVSYFTSNSISIAKIVASVNLDALSSAQASVYFLTSTGALYACGANGAGQLGDGTTTARSAPVRAGTLTGLTKVVCAGYATTASMSAYALDGSGNLWAWGYNGYGQIGNGTTTNVSSPYQSLTNVADFAASAPYASATPGGSAIAVRTNGTVSVIGYNGYGQLGAGDTTNRSAWAQLTGITTASKAFMGGGVYGSSAILLANGSILTFGYNAQGQLGVGNTTSQSSPQTPSGAWQGSVAKVIFHGWGAADCRMGVLTTGGALWVAGSNSSGGLALYGAGSPTTFAQVAIPPTRTNAAQTASDARWAGCGNADAALFVLTSAGELLSSGTNGDGRLGTQPGNLHGTDGLERVAFP